MIYVKENLRISKVDDLNLQIEALQNVKSKKTGEVSEKWIHQGYFGDLESAFMAILKRRLIDTAEEELVINSIVSKINETKDELRTVVKSLQEIN